MPEAAAATVLGVEPGAKAALGRGTAIVVPRGTASVVGIDEEEEEEEEAGTGMIEGIAETEAAIAEAVAMVDTEAIN